MDKVSLLVSSKVHEEDLSFNKISTIRRLDDFNHFALVDEDKFYVYDIRNVRTPVHQIDHYLHETIKFNDIVLPTKLNSQAVPSLASFDDLSNLKHVGNPLGPGRTQDVFMVMSSKHPSSLL